MLKDYSFLNVKQFLILLKAYRKRDLASNLDSDKDNSKHLYHIKKFLNYENTVLGTIKTMISYHTAYKFLSEPYLYDDIQSMYEILNNFKATKDNAKNVGMRIATHDKKYGRDPIFKDDKSIGRC